MSARFYECANNTVRDATVASLMAAEDSNLRALYAAWHADPSSAAEWYRMAGSPTPPTPSQGTDYRPGTGWMQHSRTVPKRTVVIEVAGGASLVAITPAPDGTSPADSVATNRKERAAVVGLYLAALNALDPLGLRFPPNKGGGNQPGPPSPRGR